MNEFIMKLIEEKAQNNSLKLINSHRDNRERPWNDNSIAP